MARNPQNFDHNKANEAARKLARIHDANDIAQDAFLEWIANDDIDESRAVWFAYANWRDKNRRKRLHARLIADPAKNEPLFISPELLVPQHLLPIAYGLLAGMTVRQLRASLHCRDAEVSAKIAELRGFLDSPSR